MARRSKYSSAVVERICDAIAKGATYEHAAGYGGISYELFRQWMRDKVAFLEAIKAAEAQGVYSCLVKIERAADDGNWQAAAWILERRHPQDYGRQVKTHELSGPGGQPIAHVVNVALAFDANAALAALTAGSEEDR